MVSCGVKNLGGIERAGKVFGADRIQEDHPVFYASIYDTRTSDLNWVRLAPASREAHCYGSATYLRSAEGCY